MSRGQWIIIAVMAGLTAAIVLGLLLKVGDPWLSIGAVIAFLVTLLYGLSQPTEE